MRGGNWGLGLIKTTTVDTLSAILLRLSFLFLILKNVTLAGTVSFLSSWILSTHLVSFMEPSLENLLLWIFSMLSTESFLCRAQLSWLDLPREIFCWGPRSKQHLAWKVWSMKEEGCLRVQGPVAQVRSCFPGERMGTYLSSVLSFKGQRAASITPGRISIKAHPTIRFLSCKQCTWQSTSFWFAQTSEILSHACNNEGNWSQRSHYQ